MTLQPFPNLPFNPQAVAESVNNWATAKTSPDSIRFADIVQMKRASVEEFFAFAQLHPNAVRPANVQAWIETLRERQKVDGVPSDTTIYHMVSRLSAYYNWLIGAGMAQYNPAQPVKPTAPKAYASARSRALNEEEIAKLFDALETAANTGNIVAKRDYAYMLWLIASGQRMNEVLQLTFEDFHIRGDAVTWTTRVKGGDIREQRLRNPELVEAIREYVTASGRTMGKRPAPLWLSHDPKQMRKFTTKVEQGQRKKTERKADAPLTPVGMIKSCQRWAYGVGITDFHLHMFRHTSATMLSEQTGDIGRVQHQLGHAKQTTTQRYLHRYGVRELVTPDKLRRKKK